jgi:hypothetical protein
VKKAETQSRLHYVHIVYCFTTSPSLSPLSHELTSGGGKAKKQSNRYSNSNVLSEWKSLFQKICVKTVIKKPGLGCIRLIVVAVIS